MSLALGVSAGLTLVLLLINILAATIDRGPIKERVTQAFATGELDITSREDENRRGRNQYKDCFILNEVLDVRETPFRRALSPLTNYFAVVEPNACRYLHDVVLNVTDEQPAPATHYHRYIHGNVATSALLLSLSDLKTVRKGLSLLFASTLVAIVLWQVFRMAKILLWTSPPQGGNTHYPASSASYFVRSAQLTFLCLLLMFCFGLAVFSMSLTHFWTDYIILMYLVIVFTWPQLMLVPTYNVITHSVFGVLTTYFEFLNGGIPLGACFILLAAGALTSGAKENPLVIGACALSTFVGSAAVMIAIKLTLTAVVFGPHVYQTFTYPLGYRTFGKDVPTVDLLKALTFYSGDLAGGWVWLGRLVQMAFFALLVLSIARSLLPRRGHSDTRRIDTRRILLLVAAYLTVPLWYAVFRQHTDEHPEFMARTSVGMLASAGVLFCVVYFDAIVRSLANAAALLAPDPATLGGVHPPAPTS
jgi:hypothetical protein